MDTYLGLDFGGTKLLIGEVDGQGRVLHSERYDTGPQTQEGAVALCKASVRDYLSTAGIQGELKGAGVGIVGVVDHQNGNWVSITHEVTGPALPLARIISEEVGVPAAIDNDVRSATAAELLWGRGRDVENFIYLNVGTGVAAGFVTAGKVLRGAHNNSGEVGHMCCNLGDETPCICGRKGCVETIVSGTGFTIQYQQLKEHYPDTRLALNPWGRIDAESLFRLADEGDALAGRIAEYGLDMLATLVMNLVRVTDPELVVLGGGVVSDGWVLERLRPRLNPATMRGVSGGVVLSAFGTHETGMIGAAALGMQRVKELK